MKQKETNLMDGAGMYAAMSIFVSRAPRLIDSIIEASQSADMDGIEAIAAKLSFYCSGAQLFGFEERLKHLIVMARENKASEVQITAVELKQIFKTMLNVCDETAAACGVCSGDGKSAEIKCSA